MSVELQSKYNAALGKFVSVCGEDEPNWEKSFSAGWNAALQAYAREIQTGERHIAERAAFYAEQKRVIEAGGHGPGSDF